MGIPPKALILIFAACTLLACGRTEQGSQDVGLSPEKQEKGEVVKKKAVEKTILSNISGKH